MSTQSALDYLAVSPAAVYAAELAAARKDGGSGGSGASGANGAG